MRLDTEDDRGHVDIISSSKTQDSGEKKTKAASWWQNRIGKSILLFSSMKHNYILTRTWIIIKKLIVAAHVDEVVFHREANYWEKRYLLWSESIEQYPGFNFVIVFIAPLSEVVHFTHLLTMSPFRWLRVVNCDAGIHLDHKPTMLPHVSYILSRHSKTNSNLIIAWILTVKNNILLQFNKFTIFTQLTFLIPSIYITTYIYIPATQEQSGSKYNIYIKIWYINYLNFSYIT